MNELSNDDAETIGILYLAEIQTEHLLSTSQKH